MADANAALVESTAGGNAGGAAAESGQADEANASTQSGTNQSRQAAAIHYRASGTNPGWTLTISDEQMFFDRARTRDVSARTPSPRSTRAGYVYETSEMTVSIRTVNGCTEAQGGGDRVTIAMRGLTFEGCGREVRRD